eukprot:1157483-Pelagomonas_calceolata.AAC.2
MRGLVGHGGCSSSLWERAPALQQCPLPCSALTRRLHHAPSVRLAAADATVVRAGRRSCFLKHNCWPGQTSPRPLMKGGLARQLRNQATTKA